MNQGIVQFHQTMIDWLVKNKRYLFKRPAYIGAFAKISAKIKKQAKLREMLAKNEDLIVPPVLIISVTNDCNLSCKGCYACSQQRDKSGEMTLSDIYRIIDEAVALGVAIILIAGGEPLMKEGILNIPKKYPDTLFVMFTNGLLLGTSATETLAGQKNLVPVISIEGNRETTDYRRGAGMYDNVMNIMSRLAARNQIFGTSITLTSKNYDEIVNSEFLKELESKGSSAAFLIEYVPYEDDFELCLTDQQKQDLREREEAIAKKHNMLIISLPGDEEKYGGCLASGRGFLHISSTGALEACPFAPYSDTNIKGRSLKQALQSKMLKEIRDNHHMLKESRGGCALIENKEWIETLLSDQ